MRNKIQIFKNYQEFKNRPNKDVNGVTQEFIDEMKKNDPTYDYIGDNLLNKGCWCCYECFYCDYCINCVDCNACIQCSECVECTNCEKIARRKNFIGNSYDRSRKIYSEFHNALDKEYGSITICGVKFSASAILSDLTPDVFDDYLMKYIEKQEEKNNYIIDKTA